MKNSSTMRLWELGGPNKAHYGRVGLGWGCGFFLGGFWGFQTLGGSRPWGFPQGVRSGGGGGWFARAVVGSLGAFARGVVGSLGAFARAFVGSLGGFARKIRSALSFCVVLFSEDSSGCVSGSLGRF